MAETYDPDKVNEEIGEAKDSPPSQNQRAGNSGNSNYVLDLSGVDEDSTDFEPLPVGTYDAIVEDTDFYVKANGNMVVKWQFSITSDSYSNRKVFDYTVLNNPVGQKIFKQILIRAGIDVDWSELNVKEFCEKGKANNKPIRLEINRESYKDTDKEGKEVIKESNRVRRYLSPATGDEYLAQ